MGASYFFGSPHNLDFQVVGKGAQGVYAVMEVKDFKTFFVISSIYVSTKFNVRKQFWDDLESFPCNLNLPWLVLGDFNEVMNQNEKMGDTYYSE